MAEHEDEVDRATLAAQEKVNATLQRLVKRASNNPNVAHEFTDEKTRHLEEEAARSQEERRANVKAARLAKWDEKIPEVFRGWTLEQLQPAFRRTALDWIAQGFSRGENIVASGGTGAGKTTLAYAISREIYGEGYKAKMWRVQDLVEAINPKAPGAAHIFESAKNCDLLTLDDLGSEKQSEWTTERLLSILDYRWQWKKPTIIATNLVLPGDDTPGPTLEGHLGDRAVSRLNGNVRWLQLVDGDRRG